MAGSLTADLVGQYETQGYLSPLRAFSQDEASSYRARFEQFVAAYPGPGSMRRQIQSKPHLLSVALYELVRRREILDAVESLIGPDILCWSSSAFAKPPGSAAFVSWHQDATYWGLEPDDVLTAWVALSPASRDSGAMTVLPGSHRDAVRPHRETYEPDNLLSRGQVMAGEVDESQTVDIVLEPGEFSLHHVRLAHASPPNRSADPRIGIAIRYIAPHVRQMNKAQDSALLVRGTDRFGHFTADPVPMSDWEEAALKASELAFSQIVANPSGAAGGS